jgi:hypothetical protein
MKKVKLIEYSSNLDRGLIIRCKGKYPYEEVVDFMICETYDSNFGYSLIVVSGYKAGLKFVVFPKESLPHENLGYAVDIEWLKKNWCVWGYGDCLLEDVWLIQNSTLNIV